MFPVLVVRATVPGGEDDNAGSGTAEGDDAVVISLPAQGPIHQVSARSTRENCEVSVT